MALFSTSYHSPLTVHSIVRCWFGITMQDLDRQTSGLTTLNPEQILLPDGGVHISKVVTKPEITPQNVEQTLRLGERGCTSQNLSRQ